MEYEVTIRVVESRVVRVEALNREKAKDEITRRVTSGDITITDANLESWELIIREVKNK